MSPRLEVQELKLEFLAEDMELAEMIDGIFHNSFAIFVVKVVTSDDLMNIRQIARTLENFVAGYIQNDRQVLEHLGDRDMIWDIYLVLLTQSEIRVEWKVELENDRFYCKKIVLPYNPGQRMEEHLSQMIIFQRFAELAEREASYLGKGDFVEKLAATIDEPGLAQFLKKNDLLALDEKKLRERFRKEFGLSVGDEDV